MGLPLKNGFAALYRYRLNIEEQVKNEAVFQ